MLKPFCNRCDSPASTVSRVFDVDSNLNVEVVVRSTDQSVQAHICNNCLAELLMASVETFENSKVVTSYHTAFRTATELESAKEELEELKTEKGDLLKRANRSADKIHELETGLAKAQEQVSLLTGEVRKAKADASLFIKKKEAEIRQRIEDEKNDPEYIAAVERRERIRSSR